MICFQVQRGPKVSLVARSSCGRCAQHLRQIRGCEVRIWRESGMNLAHIMSCSPGTSCKCCAQQGILLLVPSVCGLFYYPLSNTLPLCQTRCLQYSHPGHYIKALLSHWAIYAAFIAETHCSQATRRKIIGVCDKRSGIR
jgi:hypothetical protein